MSRGCYKAYGRKVAPSTHAQFEKLFTESTNKPCAAKSAGTVGKWGITSFTSIRSISLGQGYNGKRSRDKGKNNNVTDDPGEEPIKPKKFFKSRVDDSKGKPLPPVPIPVPPSLTKQYSRPPARSPPTRAPRSPKSPPPPKAPRSPAPPRSPSRPTRLASLVAQRKLVDTLEDEEIDDDIFQTKAINLTSHLAMRPPSPPPRPAPSPSPPPQVEEEEPSPSPAHPPIVLRICKGTAQIITPNLTDDESTPSSQHKKEGRRRSYNSDSNDSATPPKKHKKKYQDYERREAEREREREREKEKEKEREREKEAEVVEEPMAVEPAEPPPPPQVEPQPVIDPNDELRKLQELKATLEGSPAPPQPEIEEPIDQSVPENLVSSIPEQEYEATSQEVEEKTAEAEEAYPTPAAEEGYLEEAKVYDQEPGLEAVMTEESQEVRPQEVGVIQKVEPLVLRRPPGRAPKKGSIFKSRGASGEKRNAHYIHKWCDQKEEGSKGQNKAESVQASSLADEFESETLTRVTKYSGEEETAEEECEPITSVTCSKKAKEFYTVVRNVKKAHQIQESGEFQEFNDDVEYILDALQDNNPISTRCLSAITLASKCMVPAFRMHVRAHGTVTKFFRALHDATKDQRLGMCTATVMFVLSQDRLNMDIDRDSLELMLSLLESDASHSSALEGCGLSTAELKKTKDRVRSLCQEIQEQGHARHLNLDNITVGQLAMETLLSLTSKRAGEWFKEELRDLGGLEHIVKTVVETCRPIDHTVVEWTAPLLDRLKKADRCLRVLENVTLQNEENNNYLLRYGQGILVDTVIRVMRVCDSHIPYFPTVTLADKESPGAIIRECLIAILKVLINLTHDFNNKSYGSSLAGMREGLIDSSLHVLLEIPRYIPEEQKFDVMVLTLILLINLVEHCQANRRLLIEAKAPLSHNPVITISGGSAVSALVQMFLEQEELARTVERKTDAILDGKEGDEKKQEVSKSHEEFIEETVALLLQKAGRHMEHTLIGAYIALLLGYLIVENQIFEEYVRSHMPNNNYDLLLSVLQKFLNFMKLTSSAGSGSSRGLKATELLIKQLQEIDEAINANQQQDVPTDYSTSALS